MSNSTLLQRLSDRFSPFDIVLQDGENEWTLVELQARVLLWRTRLALPSGYCVALYGDNSMDWIAIDLACMEAGLICVPLPGFFSDRQLNHILESVKPAVLLSDNVERASKLVPLVQTGFKDSSFSLFRLNESPATGCPRGTGKITFTSGSTGEPRGVCLSNEHLIQQAERLYKRVAINSPNHLCVLPLSTLLENVAGVYTPLLAGGRVRTLPMQTLGMEGSSKVDPAAFTSAITTYEPTSLILIPELLQLLCAMSARQWKPPASLRFVAVGGSRVAESLIVSARNAGIPAFEGYGLSECASVVSLSVPWSEKQGTTGKPLDGIEVSIKDGEIVVSGSSMLGYFEEPESWYPQEIATGDLGEMDAEGFLKICGRAKNLMITSYGRNISPEWVESELRQHPVILDVIVFGDARPWCSALISTKDSNFSDSEISQWIDLANQWLPDYARIRTWHRLAEPLYSVPGLLTSNGKPRREAIAELYSEEIEAMYQDDPGQKIRSVS
jgi:long-subunit acyl-CoA synthetase (AMP-forming)